MVKFIEFPLSTCLFDALCAKIGSPHKNSYLSNIPQFYALSRKDLGDHEV